MSKRTIKKAVMKTTTSNKEYKVALYTANILPKTCYICEKQISKGWRDNKWKWTCYESAWPKRRERNWKSFRRTQYKEIEYVWNEEETKEP